VSEEAEMRARFAMKLDEEIYKNQKKTWDEYLIQAEKEIVARDKAILDFVSKLEPIN